MIVLMQNQVYSRYVYQMLMSYGRVAIPTLGTLTLHPMTASFNDDRSKLSPPATQISFDSTVVEEVLFERQLIDAGMNISDARQMQASLVADYEVALSKNQDFHLGQFGTFTSEGFIEKNEGTFNRYQGLESIQVSALPTYIKRNSDFAKVPDAPIILPPPPSSTKNKYLWPILLALLALIVFVVWFFARNTDSDKAIDVKNGTETEITHTSALNDDSLLTEIDSILGENEENSIVNDSDTANTEKSDVPKETDPLVKNTPSTAASKTCIVIVGAFRNFNNADRMIKRIHSKGFKTYSQIHNGFKRVGVSYDCIAKNPDLFKADVQKQFTKDAWHLHDTI